MVWQVRLGGARSVRVRRGMASQGMFRYDEVRQVGLGLARCVVAWYGRHGKARYVKAWRGLAGGVG